MTIYGDLNNVGEFMHNVSDRQKELLIYVEISDSDANLDNPLDIWIKFSNYIKPEELSFIEKLDSKQLDTISKEEINKYLKIKEQIEMSKLLLKYKNKNCTKEEHEKVITFMKGSLVKFVNNRVSKEEKEKAKKYVDNLIKENTLENYIELNQKNYDDLSIYDAYTLFIAKEELYHIMNKETNKKIMLEKEEKAAKLIHGLKNYY